MEETTHLPDHPVAEKDRPSSPASSSQPTHPLPDHPAAGEEFRRLQEVRDVIDAEISEVEALTGAKAGVAMDVQVKEDPDQQEEVTLQILAMQLDRLRQLAIARGQAYFARLGFTPKGGKPETWYLGRCGVLDARTLDPIVLDWRSPAANLYYSGQIGPMDYEAPDGRVEGDLTLKRLLNVRDRDLVSLFDTGIVSQEAYLQEVLGSVSSDRLRDIVTTIQAEQNVVIRHPLNRSLLVQGAAGSGKTTIALHRIAYLLYAFRQVLKPENMMILAPSPLFLSYISQVLPDLGVERVLQTTFENWCREGMGRRMPKIARESRLEKNLSLTASEREEAGRVLRLKGSLAMMRKLRDYLDRLPETLLPEKGLSMAGVPLLDRAELETVFLRDLRCFPLEQRVGELLKIIGKRVRAAETLLKDKYASAAEHAVNRLLASLPDGPERRQKVREVYATRDARHKEIDERGRQYLGKCRERFALPDIPGLYRAFLRDCFPGEALVPEDGTLRQEDLPMLVLVCEALCGLKTRKVRHIVIDECQDFSPFQIELLKRANPAATFTLVGDLYQGIRADEGIRSWEEWQEPVFGGQADLKQLTVSYRNTVEIMETAQKVAARYPIAGIRGARPVLRHGEAPVLVPARSGRERLALIREQVRAWQAEGFHSIALVEKTAEQARKLQRALGEELGAHLLSETDAEYRGGVLILPASIVKGMEFDCVGICDGGAANFPDDPFLCRVLYVLMTRPLHRLRIWYTGEPSPML